MAKGGKIAASSFVGVKKPLFVKNAAPVGALVSANIKGKGKGMVKGGMMKGNVKGQEENKLNAIDASLKVWIGGIAEGVTWKELQDHFTGSGKIIWAEVLGAKGRGCVAFKTQAQAAAAIATFNGSDLAGQVLEVDTWTEKPARTKGAAKGGLVKGAQPGKGTWVRQPVVAGFQAGKGVARVQARVPVAKGMLKGAAKGALPKGNGKGKVSPLNDIDPSKRVWIGGLAEGVTYKELQQHFKGVGKTTWAEVLPKGVGCVCFKTEALVEEAIQLYNGSELMGQDIVVDAWEVKPPKAKKEGKQAGTQVGKHVLKTNFLKKKQGAKGKGKGKDKRNNEINKLDAELKVWVGGLGEDITDKDLKAHFEDAGDIQLAQVLNKSQGCVAFTTASEAEAALCVFNGTDLKGSTIEVDVWQKAEKKEKKPKAAKGIDMKQELK